MIRRAMLLWLLVVALVLGAAPRLPAAAMPGPGWSPPATAYQDDDDDGGGGDDDRDDDGGGSGGGGGGDDDDGGNSGPGPNQGPGNADPPPVIPVGDDDDEFEAEDDDAFEPDDDDGGGGNDPGFQAPIVDDDPENGTDGYRAQQAVVRLAPGADINAYLARYGAFLAAAIPDQRLYLIGLPGAAEAPVVLDPLLADPDTDWAELNYAHQAPEGRPGRFFLSAEIVAPEQVAAAPPLRTLAIPDALACATGAGVVVAVLDTGVDGAHPALAPRLAPGGWNVLVNSPDTRDTGNFVDDDGDGLIDEMAGHGTHVAGIIAQVAPEAGIMPVKVLDSDGVGDAFYVAAGIYQAIGSGADVINLSLGSTQDSRVLREAVAAARDAGIVVVAAAGNADRETPPEYPALDPNAFGVAATDANDRKSAFSNYHADLLLSAPGTDIVSAFPGGGYVKWSGTSMAAPWVAGAAALLVTGQDAAPAAIGDRLAATADALPAQAARYDGLLGAGRLDVGAAACDGP